MSTKTKLLAATNEIARNEDQPRTHFDEVALAQLGESLRTKQRQPITVIPFTDEKRPKVKWKIVDGERRWRAAQAVKLSTVWIVVDDEVTDDKELHAASFTANWNRAGHTHAETARAIDRELAAGRSYAEIAAMVGKSDTWVYNEHSLLKLHPALLESMDAPTPREKRLTTKMAYTLVQWPAEKQAKLWDRFKDKPKDTAFHHLRTSAPSQAHRRPSEDGRFIESRVKSAASVVTRLMSLPAVMTNRLSDEQRARIVERLREAAVKATQAADLFEAAINGGGDE